MPDPTLIVDGNAVVVAANHMVINLFEAPSVGDHLSLVLRTPAVLDAVAAAQRGEGASTVQHVMRTPVPRSYEISVSPLSNNYVILLIRDLTHAENVERMRTDFVANASHELRTPLASISGFIETLQGSAKNDPKARAQFLGVMKAQADRMSQLIDDLLSLSRIELTEHVAPHAEADLAAIARSAVDLLSSLTKENNCAIVVSLPAKLPVIGDSSQLSQVMFNLIENALKYGGRGQKIEIDGRVAGTHVMLSVRDHGAGIAPEDVPRLTERFYRVNVQDSRMRGGTGLGLAIVKHILNRHRGRLEIQSELGNGSAFSIYIPKFN